MVNGKESLPSSVRYVKNGRGGQWWQAAKAASQLHAGWSEIPKDALLRGDFSRIETILRKKYGPRPGATQEINALHDLLDGPSKHLWVTFQDGFMWWCTVCDGVKTNPDGESARKGNFWLSCDRPWSNHALPGKILSLADLPGTVTATAGFKATICTPKDWKAMLRIVRGEPDIDVAASAKGRAEYEKAVLRVLRRLAPKDFEQLIDLVLTRTGWARVSTLGKTSEGIDIEAQNLTAGERAFVQVKSSATQTVLEDYIRRFAERRDLYARMIFAVHSPVGKIIQPADPAVQIWTGHRIAELVVRLGLGEWVESRVA